MDNEYRHDPEDDEDASYQEWISLGLGIYLIRITYPDGAPAAHTNLTT